MLDFLLYFVSTEHVWWCFVLQGEACLVRNTMKKFSSLAQVCVVVSFGLLACATELGERTDEEVDGSPIEETNGSQEGEMPFYWYEGQKIELRPSTTARAVRYVGEMTDQIQQQIRAALKMSAADSSILDLGHGIFLYQTSVPFQPVQPLAPGLLPEGAKELKVFASASGELLILTEEFSVQFKAEVTRQQQDELNANNKVSIVRELTWVENGFVLAVQEEAGADALTMANRYHDSGLTLYAEPNFIQLL